MILPVHIDPLSYCAGVLDCAGRFRIRTWCTRCKSSSCNCNASQEVFSTSLLAKVPHRVASILLYTLGGRVDPQGWFAPAWQQERICTTIAPYLRAVQDSCSQMIAFRKTQPRQRIGKQTPEVIRKLRRDMAGAKHISKEGSK